MNFLDSIWLIPLFPLFGAALMLLIGRKLDPQPPSEVAVAPGVEHVHDEHDDHGHSHGVTPILMATITITGMKTSTSMYNPQPAEEAHQHHLPGDRCCSRSSSRWGRWSNWRAKKRKRTR